MHIFDLKMHASGPGEETGKGLSSLIQIGSAFGREGGFRQLISSGPFQPLLWGGGKLGRDVAAMRGEAGCTAMGWGCVGETAWRSEIPGIVALRGHT